MFKRTSKPPLAAETPQKGLGWHPGALLVALVCAPILALPEDAEQPLLINADSGTYNDDPNGTIELSGNVQIQQGTLRVNAERMTATKRDGKLHRVVATGGEDAPVRLRQRINPGEPVARARARRIDYNIAEQQTQLTGDAFVSAGEREYTGGIIIWDMKENGIDCREGCQSRPRQAAPD